MFSMSVPWWEFVLRGVAVYLSGTNPDVARELKAHGINPPMVTYAARIEDAIAASRAMPKA